MNAQHGGTALLNVRFLLLTTLLAGVALGWFAARSRYHQPTPEPPAPLEWTGNYCDGEDAQVSLPGPAGELSLPCSASVEDVLRLLGTPEQQHTIKTEKGQRDFLLYTWHPPSGLHIRAWILFADGKLVSAVAGGR